MFDHTENNPQILPMYPSSIKGELRIILQVKDQFLLCFKHLENLTTLWDQQNRIITKDFILEQIRSGDLEIAQLKMELELEQELTKEKEQQNDGLIYELQSRGEHDIADSSKRRIKSCKTALFKECYNDLKDFLNFHDSGFIAILQNIGDRIDASQKDLKLKLRPLLEFYKDLFYLQLHFTLALTQISCFCMPLMTDSVSLIDRLFFWTERPEFELIKRSGQICDRLRDIYTRLQRILGRLFDSVSYIQEQIELQRLFEIKFYEKMKQIGEVKDEILEKIYSLRMNSDLIEEENDRLVGTLVKIDPSFINSDAFKIYNEQKALPKLKSKISKKSNSKKPENKNKIFDINNLQTVQDSTVSDEIGFKNYSELSLTSKNTNNIKNLNQNMQDKKEKIKAKNLKKWKTQIFQLVSSMKKGHSKSDLNLNNFNDINIDKISDSLFTIPISKSSGKYKIKFQEDLLSSELNQTDAFVMTSEILPKDE